MGFFLGIRSYGKAFEILFSRGFWWFLFFPVLILILLFIGGNLLVSCVGEQLYGLIGNQIRSMVEGISWLQWVEGFSGILIKVVLKIAYFFVFAALGGYVVLILMSPVYSWLSERTETYLSGKEYPFSWKRLAWEIFRGMGIALRNMFVQMLFCIVFFLCSFIPLVGLLVPFALFFTSAYFYGFSFMDYAIERKRFNIRESVRYVNKNIGLAMGIGSVFALVLMIPWIRVIACGFVSLLSVIASMVALHKMEAGQTQVLN